MAKLKRMTDPAPGRDESAKRPGAVTYDPRPALMHPITPAMEYALMTGEFADVRLRGWVRLMQDPTPDVAWEAHRGRLLEIAADHDFQPFALTHQRPTGAGFAQWAADFILRYGY